jgi:thiosulfate/3-mercaptopyruvate sulfurtransferase
VRNPDGYPRPEVLAEPEWLWQHRNDPNLRIIDCGDAAAYDRAHIPGAVRLVGERFPAGCVTPQWLKEPDDPLHLMSASTFGDLMGRLGVSANMTVVTYDDFNGTFATRLWWLLTYYGHPAVKVLNGGWQRWLDEGRPATFRETVPAAAQFTPRPNEQMRIRLDELQARHAEPGLQVVNVLWPGMFAGQDNPFGNARVGHIPGSINVPIERFLVDDEIPVIKPGDELRSVLAEAGLSPEREAVIHCHAGVRTTMGVFVTTLLGWNRVRAYDASMAEWANRDDTSLTIAES